MEINQIIHGDCLQALRTFPSNMIDSVVTDPPYGLSKEPDIEEMLTKWMVGEDYEHRGSGFMGKSWDSFVPGPSIWREVYRVLKPGGHALVFAGTRTQDLMTTALRLAGFEVRDVIEWLYFSGFPKNMDVSKAFDKRAGAEREIIGVNPSSRPNSKRKNAGGFDSHKGVGSAGIQYITAPATPLVKKWDGWGTALKPAHEPIIMARKPLGGTVVDNVERFGTGALNIDGCRIPVDSAEKDYFKVNPEPTEAEDRKVYGFATYDKLYKRGGGNEKGRFPANIVTTEPDAFWSRYCDVTAKTGNVTPEHLSKKATKKDRNSDWRGEEITLPERILEKEAPLRHAENRMTSARNTHPTVKPTDLMAWLVRLVTPPGGIVLDPFAGSGSTCVAARREGFFFIGIEQELEYVEIARKRVGEIDIVTG